MFPGPPFAVLHGAHPLQLAEALGEVAGRRKAQHMRNLRQRMVGVAEEVSALLNAARDQIVDRRHAVFPAEGMHHIILIDMCELRKHIQTNILFEMSVNVPAHCGALLAGPASGRRHSERKIGMP